MNLGHENEQREFKKSTSEMKEGMASIAAILNKHGAGELYFGVRRDGEVCGQNVSESTLHEVSQAVGNHIEPSIYPLITHEKTPEGKDYVKVVFKGDSGPYSCAGKYRIRVADEDVLMRPDELRAIFREAENRINPWDGRVSGKAVEDVNEEALRKFVERGREKERIPFEYTDAEDVLDRLDLLDSDMLTNAADVLFCKSGDIRLKMGILETHSRTNILDLHQESGTVFELVDKGVSYIINNTRRRFVMNGFGPREEIPEIPTLAIKEALMNAFAHQDWTLRGSVQVDIFNDAVEILSPGWFIDGQDPDEHLSGRSASSRSRNPLIVRTLYRSGDIEAYGTGIPRIKKLCDEAGIRIEYQRTPDGTKLVFHRNDAFGQSPTVDTSTIGADSIGANVVENVGVNVGAKKPSSFTARQKQVLGIIMRDPSATASSIAEECGITERSVQRNIRKLRESGMISREGSDKTGIWIVNDRIDQ